MIKLKKSFDKINDILNDCILNDNKKSTI